MNPPPAPQLVRLVFKSRSALLGAAFDVERRFEEILRVSRVRNAEDGVTGALTFTRLLFVQALEGPADAVETVFDRICSDLRHTAVEIVDYRPVAERGFGDDAMTHLAPDDAAEALLEGRTEGDGPVESAASALRLMAVLLRASEGVETPRRAA